MPYKNFLWGGGIGEFLTAEFAVENCLGLQRYRLLNILENKFKIYGLILQEPTINKSTGERNNSQRINKLKKEYSKADRREAANKKIRRTRVIENGSRSSYLTS